MCGGITGLQTRQEPVRLGAFVCRPQSVTWFNRGSTSIICLPQVNLIGRKASQVNTDKALHPQNGENAVTCAPRILADDCNQLAFRRWQTNLSAPSRITSMKYNQVRNKPNIDRAGMGKAEVVYIDTEKIAAPFTS